MRRAPPTGVATSPPPPSAGRSNIASTTVGRTRCVHSLQSVFFFFFNLLAAQKKKKKKKRRVVVVGVVSLHCSCRLWSHVMSANLWPPLWTRS